MRELLLWAMMAGAVAVALHPNDETDESVIYREPDESVICRASYAASDDGGRQSTWSIRGRTASLYWVTPRDYGELTWWPDGKPTAVSALDVQTAVLALVQDDGTTVVERQSVQIHTATMTKIWLRRPVVLLESDEIGPVDWIEPGDPGELFLLATDAVWRLDPSGGLARIWRDPEAGVRTLVVVGSGDDLRISLSTMGPGDCVVVEPMAVIDREGRTR